MHFAHSESYRVQPLAKFTTVRSNESLPRAAPTQAWFLLEVPTEKTATFEIEITHRPGS